MSKNFNSSNLGLSVPYQWLVPVMKGYLSTTIRTFKINSDDCSLSLTIVLGSNGNSQFKRGA